MTKKVVTLLISVMFMLIVVSGCGGNDASEIIGKWVPSTASLNGETLQYAELGIDAEQFGFTFEKGGKCTATLAGISDTGTYVFNGTSVDIEMNNKVQKLNFDNGTLTLVLAYDNDTASFSFTKAR